MYTFFSENVTSTPTPNARDDCPSSPALQQDFLSPIDNPYSYTFFDRIVTSPSPISSRGRDSPDSDASSRDESQFDADGTPIAAEPGSPDKIGTGLTLVPER